MRVWSFQTQRLKLIDKKHNMKKYQIIYADPAWDVMAGSKQSRKEGDSQNSLPLTYPTMSLEEIKGLDVKRYQGERQYLVPLDYKQIYRTKL